MITKKELIYVITIMFLLFAVVGFATIMFYDSEKAVLGISVASTLISIILAVLAIIYTYVDSSAQKESSAQLKTSAEKFAQSIEEEKEIINQFSIELKSVTALKDELLAAISENQDWKQRVIDQLEALTKKEPEQTSIQLEDIKKVFNQESEKQSKNRLSYALQRQRNQIYEAFMMALMEEGPLTYNQLRTQVRGRLKFEPTNVDIQSAMLKLIQTGHITNTDDNKLLWNGILDSQMGDSIAL